MKNQKIFKNIFRKLEGLNLRIILALFIYIYAFGVDVCERRDIEMSAYIEKHAVGYKTKF